MRASTGELRAAILPGSTRPPRLRRTPRPHPSPPSVKTFLIAPPVGNFGQATPGISVLTAWLRYKGYACVQWDLSIDAFHHFHSQEYLRKCAKVLAERAKVSIGAAIDGAEGMTRGPGVLNPPRPGEREETVLELALRTAQKIEAAKIRIREAGVESNAVDMKRCVETIRDAGLVVGATHGCFFGYNRYDVPGAFASWERMLEVATTPDQNPFLPYFQEQVLPRIAAEAPDLLGLSVTYMSQWIPALTLAHLVRKAHPKMRIVMGGSFPASVQEDVVAMPTAVGAIDGIIFGDGEEPLSRYLQAMAGEIGFDAVPGLLRAEGDHYVMNAEESKVKLDEIPPPVLDLDGIELDRYLVPKYSVALPATRGCYWGKCTFCNISNQARYRYRRRSNVRAVEDMQILKERYGTNWFDFAGAARQGLHPRDLGGDGEGGLPNAPLRLGVRRSGRAPRHVEARRSAGGGAHPRRLPRRGHQDLGDVHRGFPHRDPVPHDAHDRVPDRERGEHRLRDAAPVRRGARDAARR